MSPFSYLLPLLSAACLMAQAMPAEARQARLSGAEQLAELLKDRVQGRPVNCISLRSSPSSQIIDRTAIIYQAVGGRLYVNQPGGAEILHRDDIIISNTRSDQLCSLDTIGLIQSYSRAPRGFVTLGRWIPYDRPRKPN